MRDWVYNIKTGFMEENSERLQRARRAVIAKRFPPKTKSTLNIEPSLDESKLSPEAQWVKDGGWSGKQ